MLKMTMEVDGRRAEIDMEPNDSDEKDHMYVVLTGGFQDDKQVYEGRIYPKDEVNPLGFTLLWLMKNCGGQALGQFLEELGMEFPELKALEPPVAP